MYHAARALVFLASTGDDHDDHTKLPTRLPEDLHQVDRWKTVLKEARIARNAADYDPYPKSDAAWAANARDLKADTLEFLGVVKDYCRDRGCPI
jgi:hypothetical protein